MHTRRGLHAPRRRHAATTEPVTHLDPHADRFVVERRDTEPLRLAERFRAEYFEAGGVPNLVRWRNQWWGFRKGQYSLVPDEEIVALLWEFLDKFGVITRNKQGFDGYAPLTVTPKLVGAVRSSMAARHVFPAVVADDEPPLWLRDLPPWDRLATLVCSNAVVHLVDGQVLPPTPDLFAATAIPIEYDARAPKPTRWLRFLEDVFDGDSESIDTLQMIMGYLLTPDTSQHKAFMLIGPRRSGKGTIARVIQDLVGLANTASPTLAGLQRRFGLSALLGKTVAIIGDARLTGRPDQASIAEVILRITGQDSIDVDRKNLPIVQVRSSVRILVLANAVPKLFDESGALASRFLILRTQATFEGKEDFHLQDRLRDELPGILNWAVAGWRRLRQAGRFHQPAASSADVDSLYDMSSPHTAFLEECCVFEDGAETPLPVLYQRWQAWCRKTGHQFRGSIQTFSRDLRSVLVNPRVVHRRKPGGGRVLGFVGLALR